MLNRSGTRIPDSAASIDDATAGGTEETESSMVGLGWKDVFVDGNSAGLAFGQRQYASELVGSSDDPSDENFIWEAYYTFKVSDNVSVTPAIFGSSDVEAEGKDLFEYIRGDQSSIMGLPIKDIINYINEYKK